jgi:autotransporter-associated beta strand protein
MKDLRSGASRRPFVVTSTIAVLLAASMLPSAHAGNTWDGGGGNGNWSTAANWDADTLPTFGTGITFAGAANFVTNNDLAGLTVGGITFDPAQEAFVLDGNAITLSGGINDNSTGGQQMINLPITLSGPQTVNVIEDAGLTIGPGVNGSGVISGGGSLTKTGTGSLILGAANTYTGATTLDGGALVYSAANALTALNFGFAPTATTVSPNVSTLDLSSANLTATSLTVQSNSSSPNVITIGAGRTLAVNGAVTVGVSATYTDNTGNAGGVRTVLSAFGENLVVNSGTGHFTVGVPRSNTPTNGDPAATLDLTGLNSFTYTATTGELRVGGGNVVGTLRLASTSNTITAAQVRIGDTGTGGGNNNAGDSTLTLGLGTNVIHANSINIGAVKSSGIFNFQSGTASLTITGSTNANADITIGSASSATQSGHISFMSLAGHETNIQAGTVILGRMMGSASGGQGNGQVTFDTGTFNIVNLQMAVHSAGTAPTASGTFTLGGDFPNDTATGILNVTNQFLLINRTIATGTNASGTFTINGGTANINADILVVDNSTNVAARNATLNLAGGTLNMTGHAIGSSAFPINNVNLPTFGQIATLANLGGAGINGAGLTMNGDGTLILEGANTYTGSTAILAGTLQVGTGGVTGTLPAGGVINNGALVLNRAGAIGLSNPISGTGTFQKYGSGTVTLSSASTYAGPTDINAGALVVTGSITSDVNLNAATLAGAGNGTSTGKVGNVIMSAGSNLRPGATGLPGDAGTLTMASLTVNGGDLQFDLGATSDLVSVTGTANFAAASTISPSPAAPAGTYTVLTAGTLTLGSIPSINAPFGTRKTFMPDYSTANTIKLVVTGASKALAWTGATDSAWSIGAAGPLNWNDGAINETFFNADAVTFGDGPANRTVTITGVTVVPASVTVNNTVGNDYSIGGTGAIGGATALTKSGSGSLTLSSANTYTGGTTLNAGTLNINHAGALGAAPLSINGGSLGNTSDAPITLTANNAQNWNGNFTFSGPNDLNLGVGAVTLTTTPTVTVNTGTLTVGGVISGNFGLAKSGAGTLVLAGANTYVGGTVLSAGTLAVNHATALGNGTLTINGGGLDNTSGAAVTVTPGIPQNWNADFSFTGSNPLNLGTGLIVLGASPNITVVASTLTVGGFVGGSFGLTKSGNGTLALGGANNYSGATNINAGTVRVTNAAVTQTPRQWVR